MGERAGHSDPLPVAKRRDRRRVAVGPQVRGPGEPHVPDCATMPAENESAVLARTERPVPLRRKHRDDQRRRPG